MKAMVFAAGLGTRLRPYTLHTPKALIKVQDKPLLEIILCRLKDAGINEIVINVHHFSEQIIDFLKNNNNFGLNIHISNETEALLETGGGLKKAAHFFNDGQAFLVCNADILSDIDLKKLFEAHKQNNKALATLAVMQRETSRQLLFNESKNLCGWADIKNGNIKLSRSDSPVLKMFAFSCFQIINPSLFNYFLDKNVFSIIDLYLEAAKKEQIVAYIHENDNWLDVGTPQSIDIANQMAWIKTLTN